MEIQQLISLYIDGQLDEIQIDDLKKQLEECEEYKYEFYQLLDTVDSIKALPQQPLPENFHNELINKIKSDTDINDDIKLNKKSNLLKFVPKHWYKVSSVVAAACFIFVIIGIYNINNVKNGSKLESQQLSDTKGYSISNENSAPTPQMARSIDITAADEALPQKEALVDTSTNKKIIKKSRISIQVYDFDRTVESLKQAVQNYGGYIENSNSDIIYDDIENNIKLKSGSMVLRVPNQNYNDMLNYILQTDKVVGTYEEGIDITSNYIDTEAMLKAKELEREKLFELISKAENVNDLILLEQRLSELNGEINSYNNQIKDWDRLVEFSTISVNIEQIKEQTKIDSISSNLNLRVKNSFISSINSIKKETENLIVWLAQVMPLVIIMIVFILIAYIIFLVSKQIFKRLKK